MWRATRYKCPLLVFRGNNGRFNFAALTPALPAVDREYLYGSLDRKICDQYLEVFADFKYVRTFWDSAPGAGFNLHLMYGRMWRTQPGSLPRRRVASAYRFKTHSIHSPWRITPRLEDLIRASRNLNQLLHLPARSSPPSSDYHALEAGPAHFQDYNE